MRLGTQIYVGFALPLAALIFVGGSSIYAFNRLNQKVNAIYDDRIVPLEQLKTVSDEYAIRVVDAVNKVENDMISTSEALNQVTRANTTIQNQWEEYKQTEFTSREQELVDEAEILFEDANREVQNIIRALRRGDRKAVVAFDGNLYNNIDPITDKIRELSKLQLEIAREKRAEAQSLYQWFTVVFIFLALLALAFLLGGFALIRRGVTSTLQETVESLASSSSQIASAAEEQERVASSAAASVNETTTSADELNASSQKSAEQAEASSNSAQKARSLAESGSQAVQQTREGTETLRQQVSEISEQMVRLSDRTGEIDNISKLVSDLANQTNMLALNASVEAVRAGEHGKGFGVVASEIRKLADQSHKSGSKISELVNEIQKAIDAAVMATDQGTKTVEESARIAQEMENAFQGVREAIEQVVENNQQSSLSAKQQAQAIEQVVSAMNELNKSSKQTADGISQIKSGTENLRNLAQDLQEIL